MTQFTKITYIVLFVLIVLAPHFGIGHFFPIPERYAESLVTIVLFAIAFSVYLLHQRDIRKKEEEKQRLENECSFSSKNLNDAYQYIGGINRKLSLLSAVGTNLLLRPKETKEGRRKIFEELLMTAVTTLSHSSWGMFRFVQMATGRTEQEFTHTAKGYTLLKSSVSNKGLLQIKRTQDKVANIDNLYIISTSDTEAPIQCFFIWAKGRDSFEAEILTLRAVVDQAQLFYRYLPKSSENHRVILNIAK